MRRMNQKKLVGLFMEPKFPEWLPEHWQEFLPPNPEIGEDFVFKKLSFTWEEPSPANKEFGGQIGTWVCVQWDLRIIQYGENGKFWTITHNSPHADGEPIVSRALSAQEAFVHFFARLPDIFPGTPGGH